MAITIGGDTSPIPQIPPVTPEVPSVPVEPSNEVTSEIVVQQAPTPTTPSTSSGNVADPNKIIATVIDAKTPIVILCGPPSCGKTMTLVRMTRFLHKNGYVVTPDPTFRPADDENYKSICANFNTMLNSTSAASTTNVINFLLVKVSKDGRPICQILEAPGEHYYNPNAPQSPFPPYLETIFNCPNRKAWVLFVEPKWKNAGDRSNFVTRLNELKNRMRPHDRTIFLFNKIDEEPTLIYSPGHVNIREANRHISNLYPGIFVPYRNTMPIVSIFKPYRCDFVPFQTGTYTLASDGTYTFTEGPEEYPRLFWQSIMKSVRG